MIFSRETRFKRNVFLMHSISPLDITHSTADGTSLSGRCTHSHATYKVWIPQVYVRECTALVAFAAVLHTYVHLQAYLVSSWGKRTYVHFHLPPLPPPPPRTYPHIPPSHTREMYELLFIFSVKVQNSHLHFPRSFSIQLLHVFMRVRWYPCRRYIHSNTYLHLLLHCLICKGHLQADLVH